MTKAARFTVGTSGSGKHTETRGDGSHLGGSAAAQPSNEGPLFGAGKFAEGVRPEYQRTAQGGRSAVRNMRREDEE